MSAASTCRRRHVKRILLQRNRYQFGQPNDGLVGGGTVACTDTCIQLIVLIATGKRVSLDEVRRRSGGPTDGSRGLMPEESIRALASWGLSYRVRDDLTASETLRIVRNRGPVIIAENYWAHPQWKGKAGNTGRARNNRGRLTWVGWAELWGQHGRSGQTQSSFRDSHAVLAAWTDDDMTTLAVRDPNHNSPARPERPPWDEVTKTQLRRMMDSIRPDYGGKRLALIPTRDVVLG